MRVLVVGGSGLVGRITLSWLAEKHDVTVLDLQPPAQDVPHVAADLKDYGTVRQAVQGQDAVVFMAMGPKDFPNSPESGVAQFDVAVTGLYTVLRAAWEAGVPHAVYASSMSVYDADLSDDPDEEVGDAEDVQFPDESVPPDSVVSYGMAKRLGEEVCRAATSYGMSVVALRLCFPIPTDEWPPSGPGVRTVIATSAGDTARAFLAALEYQGHGFEEFGISGDRQGQAVSVQKARTVLGWEPLDPTN